MCFSSFLLSFIDAVWVSGSWNWIAWLSDLTHHLGITSVSARAPDESIIFTDLRGNWLNHWRALSLALLQRLQIGTLVSALDGALGIDLLAVEGPANQKRVAAPLMHCLSPQLQINRKTNG
jgi:hypothetical protein